MRRADSAGRRRDRHDDILARRRVALRRHAADWHEHVGLGKIRRHAPARNPIRRDHEGPRHALHAAMPVREIHELSLLPAARRDVRLVHEHHPPPAEHPAVAVIEPKTQVVPLTKAP